jgi:5-methylcytosine-specific restriction endonuclease McrA
MERENLKPPDKLKEMAGRIAQLETAKLGVESQYAEAVRELISAVDAYQQDVAQRLSNLVTEHQSGRQVTDNPNPGITIGIPDLAKRNEEAVFDALSSFDKKCPYCGKDQYRIGIRDRIEIDHFMPVSRGGQDVPWNILPVCKACNRKKKDRLAIDFLDAMTFHRCNEYLLKVKKRFQESAIESYESTQRLRALIMENQQFLGANTSHRFVRELVCLVAPDLLQQLEFQGSLAAAGEFGSLERLLVEQVSNRAGLFARGVVMGPWGKLCEQVGDQLPNGVTAPAPELLKKVLKRCNWKHVGRVYSKEFTTKKDLVCAPELVMLSKSELRRRGEAASPG